MFAKKTFPSKKLASKEFSKSCVKRKVFIQHNIWNMILLRVKTSIKLWFHYVLQTKQYNFVVIYKMQKKMELWFYCVTNTIKLWFWHVKFFKIKHLTKSQNCYMNDRKIENNVRENGKRRGVVRVEVWGERRGFGCRKVRRLAK